MIKIKPVLLAVILILPISIFGAESKNISNSPGWVSTAPRIAVDPQGDIHVVWVELYSSGRGDFFYSHGNPDGTEWSAPLNLSSSNKVMADTCDVDADDSSCIYAVWIDDDAIKLRIFANGYWNSAITVASGRDDYYHTHISVSAGGNIYLVWWTLNGRVYSRARVGGSWESIKQISTTGRRSKVPSIAVGNHSVYACWMQINRDLNIYEIAYSHRGTGFNSSWSSIDRVYPNNPGRYNQSHPGVALDSMDFAHIVWSSLVNGGRVVRYSGGTGSNFSTPEDISDKRMLHYPSIDGRNDVLYACWQVGAYGNGKAIFYNVRQGEQWAEESSVPSSGGSTLSDVAASPDGKRIHFTWDAHDDIYYNSVSDTPIPTNKPPKARFSFSPETGIFPLEVSFDASASYDPDGTIVQYSWDFGDGGVGSGKIISHIYQSWGTFPITLTVVDNRGGEGIEAKVIEVLRLFQPLNIEWETFLDESLFSSRYVVEIYWEKNPKNDEIAEIVFYRIYKKRIGEQNFAYRCIGEVSSDVFAFRDTDVEDRDIYVYTVTSVDSEGHESPIVESTSGTSLYDKSNKEVLK